MNIISHPVTSPSHCKTAEAEKWELGYDCNTPVPCPQSAECLLMMKRVFGMNFPEEVVFCGYLHSASKSIVEQ